MANNNNQSAGGVQQPAGAVEETMASISTILGGFENAAVHIASYLSARDVLNLHHVNRGWHCVLSQHEQSLFEDFLKRDFGEGDVLLYVAKERGLCRKKLYLAFRKRWSLPKEVPGAFVDAQYKEPRLCITWTRPDINDAKEYWGDEELWSMSKDANNLAFIARIGVAGFTESCALLRWNPDYDDKHRPETDEGQLIIDKHWSDDIGGFDMPQNRWANQCVADPEHWEDLGYELLNSNSHRLTLHVLDCTFYQVATLMDEATIETDGFCPDHHGENDFCLSYPIATKLYSVSPEGSPYFRKLAERDFSRFDRIVDSWDREREYPNVEHLTLSGRIELERGEGDDGDDILELYRGRKGLNFTFGYHTYSTISRPEHICSFLRALMKQKCVSSGLLQAASGAEVLQQPDWVQDESVLDAITSYASFEDQAGKLRLVCRDVGASALRQLERKLEETKVIGFHRGECGDWYKAQVRKGWTDEHLTSKESAISGALWLASCRCMGNLCDGAASCPGANKTPQYKCTKYRSTQADDRYELHDEICSLDLKTAREHLSYSGRFQLEQRPPDWRICDNPPPLPGVESSFTQKRISLWSLCDEVKRDIHEKVEYADDEWDDFGGGSIPSHFQGFYGVSKGIPSKQFIRSLFLVFRKIASAERVDDDEEASNKRARLGPLDEVSVGKAKSFMRGVDGSSYYARSMTIYRFYSSGHEPMEICMEYYGGFIF